MLSVDAEVPGPLWAPLRRALLDVVELQVSFGDAEQSFLSRTEGGAAANVKPGRVVRFQSADGSHLEPPAWGRDPPSHSDEAKARVVVLEQLASAVKAQQEWIRKHSSTDNSNSTENNHGGGSLAERRSRRSSSSSFASSASAQELVSQSAASLSQMKRTRSSVGSMAAAQATYAAHVKAEEEAAMSSPLLLLDIAGGRWASGGSGVAHAECKRPRLVASPRPRRGSSGGGGFAPLPAGWAAAAQQVACFYRRQQLVGRPRAWPRACGRLSSIPSSKSSRMAAR